MDESELKRNRGAISIALVDSNVSLTATLSGGFRVLGYGQVVLFRDVAGLESALHGPGFDLIIGDVDIDGGALLGLIRRLRDGDIGRNPFTAVIVTSWSRDWETIRKAVDVGVDDILANPISPGRLAERIQSIIDHRKPFIVTADYVGPERRRNSNRGSTIPAFFPPNSLAEKERGRFVSDADLKWRIDLSARDVSGEKFQRSVFQLAFLQGLAELAITRDNAVETATGILNNLKAFAQRCAVLAKINNEPEFIKQIMEINDVAGEMVSATPTDIGVVVLREKINVLLSKTFTEQALPVTRGKVEMAIRGYEQRRDARLANAG
jgi:DNA-binding response OmpR family regulator